MALTLAILGSLFCCHVQRVAAGISCRDMSRCNSYADCSDRDAMYRAGHLCVDFPYYTGGPPLTALHWSTVSKNYNCTVGSPAGCRTWTSREVERDHFNVGACTCIDTIDSVRDGLSAASPCGRWRCVQDAVADCSGGYFTCGKMVLLVDGSVTEGSCCTYACANSAAGDDVAVAGMEGTADDLAAGNDGSDCEVVVVGKRDIAVVVTQCGCTACSDPGVSSASVCQAWNCTQTSNNGSVVREHLIGQCETVSDDGAYCSLWSEAMDDDEEFDVFQCSCTSPADGYCQYWTCDGKRCVIASLISRRRWVALVPDVDAHSLGGILT